MHLEAKLFHIRAVKSNIFHMYFTCRFASGSRWVIESICLLYCFLSLTKIDCFLTQVVFFFRFLTLLLLHLANQGGQRGQRQEAASCCTVALFAPSLLSIPSSRALMFFSCHVCQSLFQTSISAEQEQAYVKTWEQRSYRDNECVHCLTSMEIIFHN